MVRTRTLRWMIAACLLAGNAFGVAATTSDSASAAASSWREVLSLDDKLLAQLLNANPSRPPNVRARALFTQSMRNLHLSYPDAQASLDAASEYVQAATDEAAFAQAVRCQITHRQALPDGVAQCEMLDRLGYEISDSSVLSYVRLTQSLYRSREGDHAQAETLVKEAIVHAEASNTKILIAQSNNWLGVQYFIKHLPKLSLVHYEAGWEAIEALDWPNQKKVILSNMATVYIQLGRYAEALLILEQAVNWPTFNVNATRRLVLQSAMTQSLIGIGNATRAERDLLALVPELFDEVQDDTKILAYSSVAQAQLALGKLDLALENFTNAIALFDRSAVPPNPRGQAVLVPYSSALREANRQTEALQVIDSVIAQLDVNSPNYLLRDAMFERAAILVETGDSEGASVAKAAAVEITEQLNSEALIYQISRLKTSIELEQSNQQLALARERESALELEASRETTLRYLSLVLGALLLAVGYLLFSRHLQARVTQAERVANERLEEKVQLRTEQLEEQMADRLQAEVERRNLLSKLAEGEKMRALGQLTAGVAHDFNNLMTVVSLTTEYLKTAEQDSQDTRDGLLDDILSATDSAARITGGLLAYARQQPLRPTVLQLDEFLEESTPIFRNALGERHVLHTVFSPCKVKVDQGQLASALLNLLLNAKEGSGERGTVEIQLQTETRSKTCEHDEQEFAVISVTDSGRGMSADELTRAIEPFYTTKASGEGAGLGLSMVYGFARQSGGDLILSSDVGCGTKVQLRLPLEHTIAQDCATAAAIVLRELPEGLKILVVEDRESVLTMLLRSLTHLGLSPQPASNADEARLMLEQGYVPDILLTDIMMPGELDGRGLAGYARSRMPGLPIILMSGYTESVDPEFEFLRKPFNMDELEKRLIGALQGRE